MRVILVTCGWTLLALFLIDVAIQLAFPVPNDPRKTPNSIAQYFDYGRSIEGKLARIVQPTDSESGAIVVAGWIDADCVRTNKPPLVGKVGASIYGMSFSANVARELKQIDSSLSIESYGGPGAGLNYSYACHQVASATGRDSNQIQIVGILASAVGRMLTLGGLTTSFEAPQPFSYPRYHLIAGKLAKIEPILRGPDDLRSPSKMRAYYDQLSREDVFYDPLLVRGRVFDHSVALRLLRRAYAQAQSRDRTKLLVNTGADYVDNPDIGPVMRALLYDFARSVRAQGKVPMVILFQDRGMGVDSLYRMLGPVLESEGITYVRTDQIASAVDARNFVADGHFTPENDRKIAKAVYSQIERITKERAW